MQAVGEDRVPDGGMEFLSPGVVQVEDRQPPPGGAAVGQEFQKEPGLGGKIFIQVAVVVQVVLREVGEDPGGEDDAVHPP